LFDGDRTRLRLNVPSIRSRGTTRGASLSKSRLRLVCSGAHHRESTQV
jgi:hypothetical protein